ncbi:hypothetical protein PQ465_19590 [Sphingobacterium oryzagri]|uniref:DUF4292 domain-containing protein n=1 Tax=Sphingobacterium oryzagri TaxID=3025669 RepID=A0ABY7WJL6_9SPHI|nr:hypothetical protein [Sphingobacterium sp. KACC 22765]WDF68485.1 hypothetical protein PQ465_19590 [Sphingobacterium sp. KACC 22765]
MNRFLIFSLFLVLFLTSCGSYQYPHAVGIRDSHVQVLNTYYTDTTRSFVYKADVEAFGKKLGGSLLIATVAADVHRVALVSDFGQTLIDISLFPDRQVVHYVMDDLNKRMLVNELADVFRTLTEQRHASSALIFMDKQHYPVYAANDVYYTVEERQVTNMLRVKGKKERFVIAFDQVKKDIPTRINIQHKKYPMMMNFTLDAKQSTL